MKTPGADGAEVLRQAEGEVFALAEVGAAGRSVPLTEAVEEAIDHINGRTTDDCIRMGGLPTGRPALDRLTGGPHPSELIVVAARPSLGKTSVGLAVASHGVRGVQLAFPPAPATNGRVPM